MKYIQGELLAEDGFQKGFIGFERNQIVEIGKGPPPEKPVFKGLIVPTFVNAHTHIGDSFIREKNIPLPADVEQLVAPPHGLKHKLLHTASEQEILNGMIHSLNEMKNSGTAYFCDFRENGLLGISQIKTALTHVKMNSLILSRPKNMVYEREEMDVLLQNSDGIGLSSISDWNQAEIKKIAQHTKRKQKFFALHVSERVPEDIDAVLDLHPDFLVHMVAAAESDLLRVRDEDIPIVLCPRSNAFFKLKTNYRLMKQSGVKLLLGTDNAMIAPPNIAEELFYLKNITSVFSIQDLLMMATYTPRKALKWDDSIHGLNSGSHFVVLDRETLKPLHNSK